MPRATADCWLTLARRRLTSSRWSVAGRPRRARLIPSDCLAANWCIPESSASPVCALAAELPWAGRNCPTAQEVFATTWDVYLTLEDLPEEPESLHTADGRPATRAGALDRLARQICADRTLFSRDDAQAAARAVARGQRVQIARAIGAVLRHLPRLPQTVILSGRGEFLARRVIDSLSLSADIVSLGTILGAEKSQAATAYALARLAKDDSSFSLPER